MRALFVGVAFCCAAGCGSTTYDDTGTSQPTGVAATAEQPIKIFLMAGQSNMVGPGQARYISQNHPELMESRDDVWCAWPGMQTGPLAPRYGFRSTSYGPELLFGHVLGDAIDAPILLVKSGTGGTTLHKDWRPPSAVARAGGDVGHLYVRMMRFFHTVVANLDDQVPPWKGRGFELAGFVWLQGENDTCAKEDKTDPTTGYWDYYEENLRDLIKDVRRDLGVPDLPVLIIQINDSGCWEAQGFQVDGKNIKIPSGPVVRAAQQKVAETTPNCGWIKTLDLNDGYHYDSSSHVEIGKRAGNAMLPLIQGRRHAHHADALAIAARGRWYHAPTKTVPMLAPASLRRNLIAYLPFDEGNGDSTVGRGPQRLQGSLTAGATWQPGLLGKAVRLTGTARVEIPEFKDPLGQSGLIEELSVSFWMQAASREPHQRVGKGVGRKYEKTDKHTWSISQRANVAGWDVTNHDIDGFFFFTATFKDGKPRDTHAGWREPHSHTDGYSWRHVAAVYDGKARRFELYMDGKKVKHTHKDLGNSFIVPSDTPLVVGGPTAPDARHAYDELAIWSRALSPEEVAALYNEGRGVRLAE